MQYAINEQKRYDRSLAYKTRGALTVHDPRHDVKHIAGTWSRRLDVSVLRRSRDAPTSRLCLSLTHCNQLNTEDADTHSMKQVRQSSLLSGRNVHWPRRMLSIGESL